MLRARSARYATPRCARQALGVYIRDLPHLPGEGGKFLCFLISRALPPRRHRRCPEKKLENRLPYSLIVLIQSPDRDLLFSWLAEET